MNNSRLAIAMRFREAAKGADFIDKLEAAVMFMLCETAQQTGADDSDLEQLIAISADRMRRNWPTFRTAAICFPNPTSHEDKP